MAITTVGSGKFVNGSGELAPDARLLLQQLRKPLAAAEAVGNLDAGTGYSNAELRDKIIQLLNALGAQG